MDAEPALIEPLPPQLDIVLPRLRAALPTILAGQPIVLAYLHGSVVDGHTLPSSDVDIALVYEPGCSLSAYQRIGVETAIAMQIQERCDIREADVRGIDTAPLMVQGAVITDGLLLYSRDDDFRVDYEVRTRKRYFDYQPTARLMQEAFYEHLAERLKSQGLLSND